MSSKRLGTIAIVAALIAALAVPVFAEAGVRGRGNRDGKATVAAKREARKARIATKKSQRAQKRSGDASETAKPKGQPRANLEKRIANKLAARKHRFDAVSANLNKRIARVASLASLVASAGGDVSAVNAKLDEARAHLASALALEDETIALFKAIPDSASRRGAFFAARAKGREAVAELRLTRFALRDAAQLLSGVVDDLQTAAGAVDAQ